MRGMNSSSVDLIYLDPPFNSKKDYAAPIGSKAAGAAFKDTWTLSDVDLIEHGQLREKHPPLHAAAQVAALAHSKGMFSYLLMMASRLLEMKRILKPEGQIYLHCDPTADSYLRVLMDAIFGARRFYHEIIWNLQTASGYKSQVHGFVRGHDVILHYSNGNNPTFNKHYMPHKPEYIARFRKMDEEGRRYRDDRSDGRRQYLADTKGVMFTDVWSDIMSFQQASTVKEYLNYPTQKPLKLLARIIEASSNVGDTIFDPFAGCATALVAADALDRQWVGCDISPKAGELVVDRVEEAQGLWRDIVVRDELPRRTDAGDELTGKAALKERKTELYGLQDGYCNGCVGHFVSELLEMDHIYPRAKGGTSHAENFQLLCSHCNRTKGSLTQEEFLAKRARRRQPRSTTWADALALRS